ncbi:hypothetical protein ABTH90_17515, partial [Acinetobacter baumannii]
PVWACVLIVLGSTVLAFWIFGGQHYLANRANIDYGHFHHVEDETDPLNWFFYLLETGVLAGGSAFLLSSLTVGLINYRAGKDSK